MGKNKRDGESRPGTTANLAEMRRAIGLDESAEFVGFGIQRPDTEEFLFRADVKPDIEQWFWTPFPDFAQHFPTVRAARRVARLYDQPTIVVYMFDTGPQYIIAVDR